MRRVVIAGLVASVINVGVPALASEAASGTIPSTRDVDTATSRQPATPLVDAGVGRIRAALDHPISNGARSFLAAVQATDTAQHSGHWCAGGLALLGGGIAAAVISGVRRDYNPQKPSPPVGVVLGTAAGVVGGIEMIRSCKR
jgi:hypothetical protein